MAGVEGRRGVVLDAELDRLRHLRPGELGDDGEGEVDARRDAAGGEDVAVADDARLLVAGADQRQQVDVGPVRRGPPPLRNPAAPRRKAPMQTAVT